MDSNQVIVREIADQGEIKTSAGIIRESFQTVAIQFGLTRENCPAHPSFIMDEQLITRKNKGLTFFGLFLENKQVGFVAVERGDPDLACARFYLEKLAVLPAYRHQGYGRRLVETTLDYIRHQGGRKVSIGIIYEHAILKNWYRGMGFREMNTRQFPHLPFTVCFMEMELNAENKIINNQEE
jgi:diamine N-acetyltransferase